MNRLGSNPPFLYMITAGEARDQNFAENMTEVVRAVSAAVDAGVALVQVREKHLSARLLCELVEAVVEAARGSAAKVLVNDRADIALAAGADGVHLTAHSMPATAVRDSFPPEFIIGVSTHTIDEVEAAAGDGADFAVFGPVFSTPGKGEPQGIEMLARAAEAVRPFPVLAIGGINADNARSAIAAGASGLAAIRALNEPASMRAIIQELMGGRNSRG